VTDIAKGAPLSVASADNEAALALYRGAGLERHAIALHKWFGDERSYREPGS